MSRRATTRTTSRRARAPVAPSQEKRTPKRRNRTRAPSPLGMHEPPEVSGGKRAALLLGCYRAAAQHDDASLALFALKLRRFSGVFGGGRVSFEAEGACLIGVFGCLAHLAHDVSTKALERRKEAGPLPDGDPLSPHHMTLLVQDALLAAEELEALRLAYKKKKAAARG
jgi:hypothetical protein